MYVLLLVYYTFQETVSVDLYYAYGFQHLQQKSLQYSRKKEATFDSVTRKEVPTWTIEKHIPEAIKPIENNTIKELKR